MTSANSTQGLSASFTYHPNFQLAGATNGSGVVGTYAQGTDGMARPSKRSFKDSNGIVLFDTGSYSYDGAGNISAIGSDAYTYDGAGRLRSSTVKQAGAARYEKYQYDAADNMTQIENDVITNNVRALNVDPATNRLRGFGTATDWSYDAAGNMTVAADGFATFGWDDLNMQTRHTEGGVDYISVYGPGDYRVWLEDTSTGVKHWTSRGPDGKILREFEVRGTGEVWTHVRDFVYGTEGALGSVHHDGYQRYFHADHLGTTRLITTADGRKMTAHHFYPFGFEAERAVGANVFEDGFETGDLTYWLEEADELSIKYTGHQRELHRNSDYMLGRHYLALANRFASVDPARDGWNLYTYVGNNPLSRIDPFGEATYILIDGQGYLANDEYFQGGHGDVGDLFRLAAETRADEIRNSEEFDPENDEIIIVTVGTGDQFVSVVNDSYESGPIKLIEVFSHGFVDLDDGGLNFGEGPAGDEKKRFYGSQADLLDPDLAENATIKFCGCYTGYGDSSVASAVAKRLGVPVVGSTGPTWFDNTERGKPVHQIPQGGRWVTYE